MNIHDSIKYYENKVSALEIELNSEISIKRQIAIQKEIYKLNKTIEKYHSNTLKNNEILNIESILVIIILCASFIPLSIILVYITSIFLKSFS